MLVIFHVEKANVLTTSCWTGYDFAVCFVWMWKILPFCEQRT